MRKEKAYIATLAIAGALVTGLPAAADVTHQNTNPLSQITYVSEEDWQPDGFVNGTTVPAVFLHSADITMDGVDNEAEWQKAIEITVPMQLGTVDEARIKAMYTEDEVFIRVSWEDASEDRQHHPWVWDAEQQRYIEGPQVEDSVMLSFEAGCEWTPSLLGGYIYDFDAWQWMAARSDPLGQALDLYGNVQDREMGIVDFKTYDSRVQEDEWILKFTENQDPELHAGWNELDRVYMLQPVTQTLHIRAVPDGGRRAPPFYEQFAAPEAPPESDDAVYPQYNPVALTGGAAEVRAKGHWHDGVWTVEFRRDRITPKEHIFDTMFNRLVQFSVHIFNGTERIDEVAESPRLFLTFLPEESPQVAQE